METNKAINRWRGDHIPVPVNVRRRNESNVHDAKHRRVRNPSMCGHERWIMAMWLCSIWIPILWVTGVALELLFFFNYMPIACKVIMYTKAVLYMGAWYLLMSTCINRFLTGLLTVVFSVISIVKLVVWENIIKEYITATWGIKPLTAIMCLETWYWVVLGIIYLYVWFRVLQGSRKWSLKYGE